MFDDLHGAGGPIYAPTAPPKLRFYGSRSCSPTTQVSLEPNSPNKHKSQPQANAVQKYSVQPIHEISDSNMDASSRHLVVSAAAQVEPIDLNDY